MLQARDTLNPPLRKEIISYNLFGEKEYNDAKAHPKTQKGKRYLGSPLRYGGGKSLAVFDILPYIPKEIGSVVSPFIGGGSVEIAIANELGKRVIAYDIFDLLVNYWQIQISHPQELAENLKVLKNTKEEYERVKDLLKAIWNKKDGLLPNEYSDLELATYYYYNHNLSYGPGFLGWMSSIYQEERKYQSMIEKVASFRCPNLSVHNERFETSIPKHREEFMYLDPPYYLEGDSTMYKGIYPSKNFPIHHKGFNHSLLCELLKQHKGGFILSYNDCSWIREAYKDFEIKEIVRQYTMGQGETNIGRFRSKKDYYDGYIKHSCELFIIGERKI